MICASEARFSSRNESHMWTFAKGENNILWDLTKRLLKKKQKKHRSLQDQQEYLEQSLLS